MLPFPKVPEHNTLKDILEIHFCPKVELLVLHQKYFSN